MSNENKKTQFNCRIDKELLDDYKKVVPNASEDIREYMQRRVNQKTNLQELQKIRLDKIKERDMLNIEIEELEEEIAEAKRLRHENNLNKQALHNAMETVIKVSDSGTVKGITRDKVKEIAESNDVKANDLFKECKKHDIKFITQRMSEVNSIKEHEPVFDSLKQKMEKHDAESIIKNNVRKFKANHKKYNDDYMRFLADPEIDEIIKNSCELKGLDYAETIEKLKTRLAMETIK